MLTIKKEGYHMYLNSKCFQLIEKSGYFKINDIYRHSPSAFASSVKEIPKALSLYLYNEAVERKKLLITFFEKHEDGIYKDNPLALNSYMTESSFKLLDLIRNKNLPTPNQKIYNMDYNLRVSFTELDEIDFFVKSSSQSNLNIPDVTFDNETDEVQYLAQVMFQNIVMKDFQRKNPDISNSFGESLAPNDYVLAMSDGKFSVPSIYGDHQSFFTKYSVEYISSILQGRYSQLTDVQVNDRLAYNSWDMVKVDSKIQLIEKGNEYRNIINKLYCIAANYCQNGTIFSYKSEADHWIQELIHHYSDNDVIAELMHSFQVQTYSILPFSTAMNKVNNTINKIRILNAFSVNPLSDETLQNFERKMLGCVISGFSLSMNWGKNTQVNSLLWNKKNYTDTVDILKFNSVEQTTFWNDFFQKHTPDTFWNDLNAMNIENYTMQDNDVYATITKKYPELAGNSRGSYTSYLSTFLYLLSVGQFIWAVATEREDGKTPLPYISLGSAFIETVFSFDIAAQKVSAFLLGAAQLTLGNPIERFSSFMGELCTKGRVVKNVARNISETIFSLSINNMTKIIDGCCFALSLFAAAVASYDLIKAIESGASADIIFSSINLLVAGVGIVGSVLAFMGITVVATIIGIIVVIVGIIVAIAQWLYNLLKKQEPTLSPVQNYTNSIIIPNNLAHPNIGNFLCRVNTLWNGGLVTIFNTQNMNTDWDNIEHLIDQQNDYSQPNSVVTSSITNRLYNFSNIEFKKPKYCLVSDLFKTGANIDIPGWNTPAWMKDIRAVVESYSTLGDSHKTAALFLIRDLTYKYRLYMTDNLETIPQDVFENDFEGQKILDIAAINGKKECTFIVFTNKSIFQISNRKVTKVVSDYDIGGEPPSSLYAFSTEDCINIIININNDTKFTYHYTLKEDKSGSYSIYSILSAMNSIPDDNAIIGKSFQITFEGDKMTSYYLSKNNEYSRYGAIDTGESSLNVYDGVKFKVPNNGFHWFYKNAFIPTLNGISDM